MPSTDTHTYEVKLRIQTDRPLTDDEQRQIGDEADTFEDIVGGYLRNIDNLRVWSVEAHGPEAVQS